MRHISLKINGKSYDVLADNSEMLANIIREKTGLTGTKVGCNQGSCGACTVMVDNKPVLSCITPVIRAVGKEITTIEGIEANGNLHLLQDLFVKRGALQCGFCTPGMIITALDYVKKNPNAGREDIKEALSGNLCRCTGYKKIIDAVCEYVELSSIGVESIPVEELNGKIIGSSVPFIEAEKKVRGNAEYADDIRFKNPLYCKFLRSIHPHAKIDGIDVSKALDIEGVVYIATGSEIPEKFGVLTVSQDETAMAIEKTRYVGEIVAAVAAESNEIAEAACKLIDVQYTPIKPFFTIESSLNDIGDAEKIHEHPVKS